MNAMQTQRYLFATILMLLGAGAMADQTVNFKVPVKLANLYPDVKSFSVGCRVTTSANPVSNWASGRTDINVTQTYDNTVNVAVTVPDSVASQVNYWVCEISLFHTGAGMGCTPTTSATVNACKAKAGTQLVTKVEGPLQSGAAAVSSPPLQLKPRSGY
jgi:hypothetical protein